MLKTPLKTCAIWKLQSVQGTSTQPFLTQTLQRSKARSVLIQAPCVKSVTLFPFHDRNQDDIKVTAKQHPPSGTSSRVMHKDSILNCTMNA